MGTVIMHNVVSVDGFIADQNDDVGPLHDWYFSGDTPVRNADNAEFDHSGVGVEFKVSAASAEYVQSMWDSIGVIVMGRRLGLGTVLVLSGVTHADDPRIAAVAPDHVVGSIRDLAE